MCLKWRGSEKKILNMIVQIKKNKMESEKINKWKEYG